MDELDQLWPLGVDADLFLNKVSVCRVQLIARRCVCFVSLVLFCFVCCVAVAGLAVCFVLCCLLILLVCFVLSVWLVGCLWLLLVVVVVCVAIFDVCGQVVQRDSTRNSFVRLHLCWCAAPLGILDKADGVGP